MPGLPLETQTPAMAQILPEQMTGVSAGNAATHQHIRTTLEAVILDPYSKNTCSYLVKLQGEVDNLLYLSPDLSGLIMRENTAR